MQLHPEKLGEEQARAFQVTPGWWALDDDGQPVLGPYPGREATLVGIAAHGKADPGPGTSLPFARPQPARA